MGGIVYEPHPYGQSTYWTYFVALPDWTCIAVAEQYRSLTFWLGADANED